MGATPWFDGTIVGFDLETTGLDREMDEPVSFAFAEFEFGTLTDIDEGWIMPSRSISPGAAQVHGLNKARLSDIGATTISEGIGHVSRRLRELSELNTPIVGANLSYDLTMIDRCMRRLRSSDSLATSGWCGPAIDVLVIDRAFDQNFKSRPVRTLTALCEHYGVKSQMHTASGDATAAVEVLRAQVSRFEDLRNMDLPSLYEAQVTWHRQWCESLSAYRVSRGRRPLDPREGSWPFLKEVATTGELRLFEP
jgi:DNA polymerase-3 subunit epsilon